MKTVAVTGGIGAGKSAVCRYLQERGVPVYDSDSRTKSIYDTVPSLLDKVEAELGGSFRAADGRLDRQALARAAFSSPEALSRLEAIIHPAVLEDFRQWRTCAGRGLVWRYCGTEPFVVMESAIVLRTPLFLAEMDAVVLVDAPLDLRVERAGRRDGRPPEEILSRVSAQPAAGDGADAVIVNDSDEASLRERTDFVFKNIIFA